MVTGRAAQALSACPPSVAAVPAPAHLGQKASGSARSRPRSTTWPPTAARWRPPWCRCSDVKLIGDRIFLSSFSRDREAERTIEALLAERYPSNGLEARVASRG